MYSNWSERGKIVIIHSDIILHTENPKDSKQKLPKMINEFNHIAGYKISIQKSVAFLYTNNEISQSKKKKSLLK